MLALVQACGAGLEKLCLRSCSTVSDKALECIAQHCSRLVDLDLGWCGVSDQGLLQLAARHGTPLVALSLKVTLCIGITEKNECVVILLILTNPVW